MQGTGTKGHWDFFDGIFCINLKSRDDRYHAVSSLFQRHQIPAKFHRVTKHPNGGLQGCFESHVQVIKNAYDAGMENVLIFEDDLVTTKHYDMDLLADAIDFMKSDNTWDIFYLGVLPSIGKYKTKKTAFKNIYNVRGLCCHAYVVSRRMMEKFKDTQFTGIPLDYIHLYNSNCYAVGTSMFAQGADVSDNDGNIAFGLDMIPGAKQKFFAGVEWYAYHINMPLVHWVPILLVIWYLIILMRPEWRVFHIGFLIFIILFLYAAIK